MVLYAEGYSVSNFLVSRSNRRTFLEFINQGMSSGWDDAARKFYSFNRVEDLEQASLKNLTTQAATGGDALGQRPRRRTRRAGLAASSNGRPCRRRSRCCKSRNRWSAARPPMTSTTATIPAPLHRRAGRSICRSIARRACRRRRRRAGRHRYNRAPEMNARAFGSAARSTDPYGVNGPMAQLTRQSLVPTLRVGTHVGTLRVPYSWQAATRRKAPDGTQSVPTCVPTRSVGTRKCTDSPAIAPSQDIYNTSAEASPAPVLPEESLSEGCVVVPLDVLPRGIPPAGFSLSADDLPAVSRLDEPATAALADRRRLGLRRSSLRGVRLSALRRPGRPQRSQRQLAQRRSSWAKRRSLTCLTRWIVFGYDGSS